MIFKQYTLNGKRRVSNGKRHVIQRKQTRENVCGLCLNANSCNERKIALVENFNQTCRLKETRQPWIRARQPALLKNEKSHALPTELILQSLKSNKNNTSYIAGET